MKHGKNWRLCLIVILLIALIMPTTFADPLTREEIEAEIDSELHYPGSAVREFAFEIVTIYETEIKATAEKAAATAARPLLTEISGLEAEVDVLREWIDSEPWIRFAIGGVALIVGGAIGYGLGYWITATRLGRELLGVSISR